MGEVELIDEALVGCYNLQNRIATLLAKLSDIKEGNGDSFLTLRDPKPIRTKHYRKRRSQDKMKAFINNSFNEISSDADNNLGSLARKILQETESSNPETDLNLSDMFSKLSDSFIEENSDAYSRRFSMEDEHLPRKPYTRKNWKYELESNGESTRILSKLNEMIVKVNAENSFNTKAKKVRMTRVKKAKGKKNVRSNSDSPAEAPVESNIKIIPYERSPQKNLIEIDDLEPNNIYYTSISDFEYDDSEFCSGLRSVQEINSAYAKIDKRLIEVKRSVESVVVGMKHVDEIVNRQKGIFHLNFLCAENETFICRH